MSPPYQTRSSQIVWRSRWYRIRQDALIFPNGEPGVYNVMEHPGAVWIVPLTARGEVALIRHYRYTVNEWLWEVPAGSLEPGVNLEEQARRELLEEVGGVAQAMYRIGRFHVMPGISNQTAHIFLATGVTLGAPAREASEVMETHLLPWAETLAMAQRGQIEDGPSALALILALTDGLPASGALEAGFA